jgi:hypothetical protein
MDSTRDNPVQEAPAEYGVEVLCASWNPLVTALAEPVGACRDFVADVASSDVDSFLSSFYRSQQS